MSTMEATEVGVLLRVDSEIDLSAATAIVLQVKGPSDLTPRNLTMTQGVPNNIAERTTIATDFPVAGNYFIQLKATFPTKTLYSPGQLLYVGELAPTATVCP
jgi:hypothetical protein